MKLSKIKDILHAEFIWGEEFSSRDIKTASSSDLLSDVLAFTKADTILLTGIVNSQVVRTAEMVDICVICFVRGKKPLPETIQLAQEKNIPLLCTAFSMYRSCGELFKNGLKD